MERISSLMDGELDAHEAGRELNRLKTDAESRATWETFHLIGDVMRGDHAVSARLSARLHERLAAEPTVLAPRRAPVRRVMTYAMSAAASFSAVALVGWMAFYSPLSPQPAQVASTPVATPTVPVVATVASQEQLANVPAEGRMNEYLMAHQAF